MIYSKNKFGKYIFLALLYCITFPSHSDNITHFVPRVEQSPLSLGTGVDFIKQDTKLACFEFNKKKESFSGSPSYKYSITVHSSTEQVERERTKTGSLSVNAKAVKLALKAWAQQASSTSNSTLYAIIEGRYEEPKYEAKDIVPLPALAEFLKTGSPDEVFERCGSHIATTEHTLQSFRMVINLSSLDEWEQQQVKSEFSTSGRYGWVRAKASGDYRNKIVKLSQTKKLAVEVEGSGAIIPQDKVLSLFEEKGGDFKAIAVALSGMVSATKIGDESAYVPYGYSVTPVAQVANRKDLRLEQVDVNLIKLQETETILKSQIADIQDALKVVGLPIEELKRLKLLNDNWRKDLKKLQADIVKCMGLAKNNKSKEACENSESNWNHQLVMQRNLSGIFEPARTDDENSLALKISSRFPANATLVAVVNDAEYGLDTIRLQSGDTVVNVAHVSPSDGATTSLPLLASLLNILNLINETPRPNSVKWSNATIAILGCTRFQIWRDYKIFCVSGCLS